MLVRIAEARKGAAQPSWPRAQIAIMRATLEMSAYRRCCLCIGPGRFPSVDIRHAYSCTWRGAYGRAQVWHP
jgi:hypothetical protein